MPFYLYQKFYNKHLLYNIIDFWQYMAIYGYFANIWAIMATMAMTISLPYMAVMSIYKNLTEKLTQ